MQTIKKNYLKLHAILLLSIPMSTIFSMEKKRYYLANIYRDGALTIINRNQLEITDLNKKINSLEQQTTEKDILIKNLENEFKIENQNQINNLNLEYQKKLDFQENKINDLEKDLDFQKNQINNLSNKNSEFQKLFYAYKTKQTQDQIETTNLQLKIKSLELEINEKNQSIENLKNQLKIKNNNETNTLKLKSEENQIETTNLKLKIKSLQREINQKNSSIYFLKNKLSNTTEENTLLKSTIQSNNPELIAESFYKKYSQCIVELKQQKLDLKAAIKKNNQSQNENQKEFNSILKKAVDIYTNLKKLLNDNKLPDQDQNQKDKLDQNQNDKLDQNQNDKLQDQNQKDKLDQNQNDKLQDQNQKEVLKNNLDNLVENITAIEKLLLFLLKKQVPIQNIINKCNQIATEADSHKQENTKLYNLIFELLKNQEDNQFFIDTNDFKGKELLEIIIDRQKNNQESQNIQQIQNI